jgi:alkylation response protein AidB-like acyl-CoA dehydrogenase
VSPHELTDEQRDMRALTRRFADEEIVPHAATWDRGRRFPLALFGALGELGLMGACVPLEHGGAGADFLSYVLVLEELSRAHAGVGVAVATHTSAGTLPVLAHGTPDQIERMVPPLAQGHELAASALTEADSGSDASAMRVRYDAATQTVTGVEHSITNGSYARHVNVVAREDADVISAFVSRTFSAVREERTPGLLPSSTANLVFAASPVERLGPPGGGMRVALSTLDGGRIASAAQAVGIAQAALELATPELADRQNEIEAARALVWRAARLKDAGLPHAVEGAQAKRCASRLARHWTGETIPVLDAG